MSWGDYEGPGQTWAGYGIDFGLYWAMVNGQIIERDENLERIYFASVGKPNFRAGRNEGDRGSQPVGPVHDGSKVLEV